VFWPFIYRMKEFWGPAKRFQSASYFKNDIPSLSWCKLQKQEFVKTVTCAYSVQVIVAYYDIANY